MQKKTINISIEDWKYLKQKALDKNMTIIELISEFVKNDKEVK